jgi:hypothetical protein
MPCSAALAACPCRDFPDLRVLSFDLRVLAFAVAPPSLFLPNLGDAGRLTF